MFHKNPPTVTDKIDVNLLLANERTLLAWIRTGLTVIAGGVAVSFVATNVAFGAVTGIGAILYGGLLALIGYTRFLSADKAIRSGELPTRNSGGIVVVIGVVMFSTALVAVRGLNIL